MSFFFVATMIVVWMSVPFVAFTVYAALTQVPPRWSRPPRSTAPGPGSGCVTSSCRRSGRCCWSSLLLQIIWDLRVFTQIYMLQKAGGVTRDTNLLGTYIYRSGIGEGDFGAAAAVAMFMLALTVMLTAPYVSDHVPQEED